MNVLDVDHYEILKAAYEEHGTIIVCFDFDNTVFDYHGVGLDCTPVINLIKRCQDLEFKLLCFTTEDNLSKMVQKGVFLRNMGITKASMNRGDGVVMSQILTPPSHFYHKPYANIYIDDKAGLKEAYERLNKLVTNIENHTL